ncbi:hypothetical protein SISSUDRAFT_1045565 [Sistotremastrum suecicum HHB10207 ss-3]|uniref:DUF6533 domain-containing protein n=1 Tax=Sistotremastrum suecicum HHB10207 ss-3 TaxID=1314776 RepID=A0A166EBI1_9AGAM|nr:hypothetical protein SISSUDRAFT_1045565 [Sistotremastrum suecicum HHB10207 ss-3]
MSTSGLTFEQEWQELITALSQLRAVNYSLASALGWLVYDTICNAPSEIDLIWRAKWSFPKFLYIFARYWGIFLLGFELGVNTSVTLGLDFCKFWFWFYSFSGFVVFTTTVNIIFLLRIHALYNRSKKVLALLIGLVLLEFGTELYVTLDQAIHDDVIARPVPFFPGCLLGNGVTDRALVAWVPNLFVGFSFFVLTMIKLYQTLRDRYPQSGGVLQLSSRQIKGSLGPMLTMFIRDGALFFFLLFGVSVVCTVMTVVFKHTSLVELAYPWLIAVYAYSGSRLILNLRSVVMYRTHHSSGPETLELSNRSPKLPASANSGARSLSYGISETVLNISSDGSLDLWSQNAFKNESVTETNVTLEPWKGEEEESIRSSSEEA